MTDNKTVLMVGWNPEVVDYSRWPGLTAEKVRHALNADRDRLNALGYEVELCFIHDGSSAAGEVAAALDQRAWDCVLIGAGVRKDEAHLVMFEALVNVVHESAPSAKICFNTGPTDSVDAVQRWIG
ncbi:MAG: hypothetical protein OXG56_08360 [Gammaproteobacteria bacterium]|nr:hypothetical protein [Gammaproteobacteria bacterium]